MNSVLCTGGAGFIGSALVKRLVDSGYEVSVIDDLSRGDAANLDGYMDKLDFMVHDMKEPLELGEYDVVFDLAARVYGITKLYEDEPSFLRENTLILLNTLECVKDKVKHYFYVSSSCVYNYEGCPLPHREEDASVIPETGYDISKRFGEEIIKLYARKYSFKYTIIRPFNVYGYGEGEEAPHVITDFFHRLLREKKEKTRTFWILGDGDQTRSFTYIEDFVDALIFLLGREEKEGATFNIGSGIETKIIDLLEIMFRVADLQFEEYTIVRRPPIEGDVMKRNPDISKLRSLGWKPKYSLEDGLRETWNAILMEVSK